MPLQSKIEINPETGTKCLIVYYDSEKDNFDKAIEAAQQCHKIESGQIATIAVPKGFGS